MPPETLFDKVWGAHLVAPESDETPAVLGIDLHMVHEVTSPQAFAELRARGLRVRHPERTLATADHSTPTTPARDGRWQFVDAEAEAQVDALERHCREEGIRHHGLGDPERGIVHVVGPERGATQPGMTVVCGDSHTSTHGAFGALAFGIGTSEVAHVLATQCLLQRRPRTMAVEFRGTPSPDADAKDLALAMVARLGFAGGTGHVLEYRGEAVRALSMEGRMTLCNMSIEAGARAGMVAPDATTFAWLRGRPMAPQGADFDAAVERWRGLASDPGAEFDATIEVDVEGLGPLIGWGSMPDQSIPVDGTLPQPGADPRSDAALQAMGLTGGEPLLGRPVDIVFVGSCTNGRLEDLRAAAEVLRGRRIRVPRMLVVPGSGAVARAAEAEGLDRVFREAGAEWREPGCSMCIAMNGDAARPGERVVSTSNRNFLGRQGPGSFTHLASPRTAAACAVAGAFADPRAYAAVAPQGAGA